MKDIKGWEGKYAVTEDGKVWSYVYGGHWLKANTTKKGDWYMSICFGWGESRKGYKVHRLVAQAYIPNPKNLPDVNHKNGDKTDNRVENLEWCTRQQNIDHSWRFLPKEKRNLCRGENTAAHKLTESEVRQIKMLLKFGNSSMRKIAKQFHVSPPTIQGINRGWYWAWVH